jgi:hypothetical protein
MIPRSRDAAGRVIAVGDGEMLDHAHRRGLLGVEVLLRPMRRERGA